MTLDLSPIRSASLDTVSDYLEPALLQGRNGPCPKCGGTDRAWAKNGRVFCRHCAKKGMGPFDIWLNATGQDFSPTAAREFASIIGVTLDDGHDRCGLNAIRNHRDAARRAKQARLEKERRYEAKVAQRQGHAALESQRIFESTAPASLAHDYLAPKLLPEKVALSVYRLHTDNRLVSALRNIHGQIRNLQYTAVNGDKRFHPGALVTGCFCVVQRKQNDQPEIVICEGIATGCSLTQIEPEALVIAAMNAGNLLPVAKAFRHRYPRNRIVIAGDNDRFTKGNPGRTKAIEAARAVNGEYALPEFPLGMAGTDFNDLYCAGCLS